MVTRRVRRAPVMRGLTLVELMVTLAITAALMLAVVPLIGGWVEGAQVADARGKLVQAFGQARALALRNPDGVPAADAAGTPLPAAGLRLQREAALVRLLVCRGDPAAAACAVGGAALTWQVGFPPTVATTLGGVTPAAGGAATVALDNRGQALSSTTYLLRRGSTAHDETGTLL